MEFPPTRGNMVCATANFLESAMRTSQQPVSTVNSILVAIVVLYELLGVAPTHDPLITRLQRSIIHTHMKRPITVSPTFDPVAVKALFHKWAQAPAEGEATGAAVSTRCVPHLSSSTPVL